MAEYLAEHGCQPRPGFQQLEKINGARQTANHRVEPIEGCRGIRGAGNRCHQSGQHGLQCGERRLRSEEHTSELQSLMRISYAVFCLKKKTRNKTNKTSTNTDNKRENKQHNTKK